MTRSILFKGKCPSKTIDFGHVQDSTTSSRISSLPNQALELTQQKPTEVLADVLSRYDTTQFSVSFSGAEDVVVIDMATCLANSTIQVFTLDIGRLHEETYEFIETVRNHYDIDLRVLSPDAAAVNELVRTKGLFSFYQDGHIECCGIRKIKPLQRHMQFLDAWVTGQRRDQGITRTAVPYEELDKAFSTPSHEILKFNPLAAWTSDDVWSYIEEYNVPVNKLHSQGFLSIRVCTLHAACPTWRPRKIRSMVVGTRRRQGMRSSPSEYRSKTDQGSVELQRYARCILRSSRKYSLTATLVPSVTMSNND